MKLYVIDGDPIPLKRPRLSYRKVYDSQKNQKLLAGITMASQHGNDPIFDGPLEITITFYMYIPVLKRKQLLGKPHAARCDLDNLIKYVLDAANGILYHDDAQIAVIHAKKVYDMHPRTEFLIKPIL